MATATELSARVLARTELRTGDRMTRAEFHRLYEEAPEEIRAELIGGIVYMASPLGWSHGTYHPELSTVFVLYKARTPGLEVGDNCSVQLGGDSEPQPDLFLRILPEFGGQSRNEGDYVAGPPELVAEIAHSSRAIDLHAKKDDYARYGVVEYAVVCLKEVEVRWFDLRAGQLMAVDGDGVFRSRVFPGLWIHSQALLSKDTALLISTLEKGLATSEHVAFAEQLANRRR